MYRGAVPRTLEGPNATGDADENTPRPGNARLTPEVASTSLMEAGGKLELLEEALRAKVENMTNFGTPAAQARKLKAFFKVSDTDGSGTISRGEFAAALARINYSVEEARLLFDHYDTDGSGTLDYNEFANICRQRAPRAQRRYGGGSTAPGASGGDRPKAFASSTIGHRGTVAPDGGIQQPQWVP